METKEMSAKPAGKAPHHLSTPRIIIKRLKRLKLLTKLQEICFLVFFISSFTVSVTPSINTPESSNDSMIIIILFISSFKINKVNPFPALTAPFPLTFLANLFIALEVKLLTNPGKFSLAKGKATFVSAFFLKLPNQKPKDPLD